MSIVAFIQTGAFLGTVNVSATFTPAVSKSLQHNFGSPVTVWSYPALQSVENNDDDGTAAMFVAQFVDNHGAHNGQFQPGIFAQKCTSVSFNLFTVDCIANTICTSQIFG